MILLLLAASLGACAPRGGGVAREAPAPPAGRLAEVVDSATRTPPLDRAYWGIEVVEAGTGQPITRRNEDRLFVAASNTKIATMVAAFDLLGADYRWTTTIEAVGGRDGVAEALVVRGSGDPSLSGQFHDEPLAPLQAIADSLARAGLRRVDGPIIIDQSRFDSVLVHPAWENFDLDWYYAAPVAPFAVLEASYPVVMTPGPVGAPARVELLVPEPLVGIDADVRTVPGDRSWSDDLRRLTERDSVVLRGAIGADATPDTSHLAQVEPGRFAGRALAHALELRGIPVAGPVRVTRDPQPVAGADAVIVTWRSPPLATVARVVLQESGNWVAEQILKTLGAEHGTGGSWSEGTAVIERHLAERVGIDAGAVYLRDGSGLTHQNLLTPRALVSLLEHAARRPWAPAFRAALAAPGETEGTLRARLLPHASRLEAKTGTIRHVSALSGYLVDAGGRELIFSIIVNASGRPARDAQRATDAIIDALVETRN